MKLSASQIVPIDFYVIGSKLVIIECKKVCVYKITLPKSSFPLLYTLYQQKLRLGIRGIMKKQNVMVIVSISNATTSPSIWCSIRVARKMVLSMCGTL